MAARIAEPLPTIRATNHGRTGMFCDLGGRVARTIVDDDHLRVEIESRNPFENLPDRRLLVVGGNEEGDAHEQAILGVAAQ